MACDNKTIQKVKLHQSSIEYENTVVANIVQAASDVLQMEFYTPITRERQYKNKQVGLRNKIDDLQASNEFLQSKLKDANTKPRERVKIRKDINKNKQSVKVANKALKKFDAYIEDEPQLFKEKENLLKTIQDRLIKLTQANLLGINDFSSYVKVLSHVIEKKFMSGSIDNADLGTVIAVNKRIQEIFKQQDNGVLFDKGFYGKAHSTIWDPALAMLKYDKSLKAVNFVQESYDVLTTVSQKTNRYKSKIDKVFRNLRSIITSDNLLYKVDAIDSSDITPDERDKSYENLSELTHDLLDGRTKYIVPKTINLDSAKSPADKSKLLVSQVGGMESLKKISNIIDYAIKSGVEKDIHNIPQTDLYYVSIMEKLPNGKEVYNAFLVPSSYGKNGRALFTYPMTPNKKNISNKWKNEIIALHEKNDLTGILKEGLYEADQAPMVYEGKDKFNNDFATEGYINYTPIPSLDKKLEKNIYNIISFFNSMQCY